MAVNFLSNSCPRTLQLHPLVPPHLLCPPLPVWVCWGSWSKGTFLLQPWEALLGRQDQDT